MTNIRKKIITSLVCAVMLLIGICALSACESRDLSVTFNIEGSTQSVEVVDGKVQMPSDPTKEFYEFRGWYTTSTYDEGTEFTADTEVTENTTVYAYFVPIYVNISVNGEEASEIMLAELQKKTEEHSNDALDQSLTFDGWYIDSGYGTKYTTQDVDNLYARYMAKVTFHNGYEEVYSTMVGVGTTMKKPADENIVKRYMSSEDMFFVDAEGNAFDFENIITANTDITVKWKSPYLMYEKIEGTDNYMAVGFSSKNLDEFLTFPCVSILSQNIVVGTDESGAPVRGNVVAFDGAAGGMNISVFGRLTAVYQFMFADGIEYISNFYSNISTELEKVVLPNSLKILENSFQGFTELKEVNIPSGLEVIIDCFWKDYNGVFVGAYRETGYDFDIVIPAGVKTLSLVPVNVKFAEGSPYYVEDGMIFKKDGNNGKILVSITQSKVENNSVVVPEGVTGIQVGILDTLDYQYLYLPSTLEKVEYTVDASDYDTIYNGSYMTKHTYINAPIGTGMNKRAFSIVGNLDKITYVIFNTSEYPASFQGNKFLFTDGKVSFDQIDGTKLVYTAIVTEGDITLNIGYINSMDGGNMKYTTISVPTASTLNKDELLAQLGITSEALGINITIESIKQFGLDYEFGVKNCNQYIEITYKYDVTGFTTSENSDGTLTVTGFDADTAQLLDDNTYLVIIPNTLNGKTIVAIADGAFKDNNRISKVYIGSSVKAIGAEAFMNCSNLGYINIAPGGLETVGRSAFENVGAIYEDGEWIINPDLDSFKFVNFTKTTVYLYIPLANLKTIEPYAFKSVGICTFMPVDGEERRKTLPMDMVNGNIINTNPEANMYYFHTNASGDIIAIYKYVLSSAVRQSSIMDTSKEIDVTVWNYKLIAMAGGYFYNSYGSELMLGFSMRPMASFMGEVLDKNVISVEVMEGSVYFIKNSVVFGLVTKVHENAFTDMGKLNNEGVYVPNSIYVYTREGTDIWMKKDDIINQADDIFENGWWCGIDNSENTVTSTVKDGTSLLV